MLRAVVECQRIAGRTNFTKVAEEMLATHPGKADPAIRASFEVFQQLSTSCSPFLADVVL